MDELQHAPDSRVFGGVLNGTEEQPFVLRRGQAVVLVEAEAGDVKQGGEQLEQGGGFPEGSAQLGVFSLKLDGGLIEELRGDDPGKPPMLPAASGTIWDGYVGEEIGIGVLGLGDAQSSIVGIALTRRWGGIGYGLHGRSSHAGA